MNPTLASTNQTEILGRSFDLHANQMSADAAQFILSIDLDQRDRQRLEQLAEKARQDILSATEEMDLEEYRRAGRLMEMMKLKARIVLKHAGN
jgi:hypothetical protein